MIKSALLILNIVAAFNGILVAAVLAFQERMGPTQIRIAFAGLLFSISMLLAIFIALDNGAFIYSMPLGVLTDVMGLFAGALFFNYVAGVSGRAMSALAFAPVGLYLASVVIAGGRYLAPTDIAPIIAVQASYSAAAFLIYMRSRTNLPPAVIQRRENRHLPALFAGIALLHGAQFLRLAFPGNNFFFDLVPFVGALGLILLVFYGVAGSQTLGAFGQAPRGAPSPPVQNRAKEIETALQTSKAYLDPDISLPKVAGILGMKPREVSAFLNQETGQTFRDFINRLRIAEAQRLLQSPDEAETSIEAIGLLSGFRARSSFYEAFKARTGQTPAEFRKSKS